MEQEPRREQGEQAFVPLHENPTLCEIAQTDQELADRLRAQRLAADMLREAPDSPAFRKLYDAMDETIRTYLAAQRYSWEEKPLDDDENLDHKQ